MVSDIREVVRGIQGFPVSETAPSVGQVLAWDGYAYTPTTVGGSGGLTKDYITADGYWTCPDDVYTVLLIGAGGGGAGSGGASGGGHYGGGGGGGTLQQTAVVSVVPSTVYAITIGQGGIGGAGGSPGGGSPGFLGTSGGNTTFGTMFTAEGGSAGVYGQTNFAVGGLPIQPTLFARAAIYGGVYPLNIAGPAYGGSSQGYPDSGNGTAWGSHNPLGFAGGTPGSNGSGPTNFGGGGGGGGPQGVGANGGNGNDSGAGGNASNAGNNTGVGGGGGGAGNVSGGGAGGNGGSGYLFIVY